MASKTEAGLAPGLLGSKPAFRLVDYCVKAMPLTRYERIGDFDKSHSFRHANDRKILTNPRAIEKLHKRFAGTSVDFEFYMVNLPGYSKFINIGQIEKLFIQRNMSQLAEWFDANGWPGNNSINVIYTNNLGNNRLPMTPWILAHRLSHAMATSFGRTSPNPMYKLLHIYYDHIKYIAIDYHNDKSFIDNIGSFLLEKNIANNIGTTRAARNHKLTSAYELFHELFAQYILTGEVHKLNLPPRQIATRFTYGNPRPRNTYYRTNNDTSNVELQKLLDDLANMLNNGFYEALKSSVGNIYVM